MIQFNILILAMMILGFIITVIDLSKANKKIEVLLYTSLFILLIILFTVSSIYFNGNKYKTGTYIPSKIKDDKVEAYEIIQ